MSSSRRTYPGTRFGRGISRPGEEGGTKTADRAWDRETAPAEQETPRARTAAGEEGVPPPPGAPSVPSPPQPPAPGTAAAAETARLPALPAGPGGEPRPAEPPPRPGPIRPARRIALLNQKGGVGKTTTAIHLGAALALDGRPTLLIDLDPQAHLSLGLGLGAEEVHGSLYDVLCENRPLAACVHDTRLPRLSLVPSHLDLSGAELMLANAIGREGLLRDAVLPHLEAFDRDHPGDALEAVLFDCPPSLGLLTINALVAADEILIPLQPHFYALQGMARLLDIVRLIRQRLNPRLRITGILPCLVDPRLRLSQEVLEEVRGHFGDVVYRTCIRSNVKLAESPSHGLTVFEYAPESRGASDYKALAQELLERGSEAASIA